MRSPSMSAGAALIVYGLLVVAMPALLPDPMA
jgi:hypothetical protein